MAVGLVRSGMEKWVGGWACEIGDGGKVCGGRKKRWRDTENGETVRRETRRMERQK